MPINKKKMAALKKEYGAKKGEEIYYRLENKILKHKTKPTRTKRKNKRKNKK